MGEECEECAVPEERVASSEGGEQKKTVGKGKKKGKR
jgi:hypothetical protein